MSTMLSTFIFDAYKEPVCNFYAENYVALVFAIIILLWFAQFIVQSQTLWKVYSREHKHLASRVRDTVRGQTEISIYRLPAICRNKSCIYKTVFRTPPRK